MTQDPEELKALEEHDATHLPSDASRLLAQVRQNVEDPAHELQEESQAVHVVSRMPVIDHLRRTCASQVVLRVKECAGRTALHALTIRQYEARETSCTLQLVNCRSDVEIWDLAGRALSRAAIALVFVVIRNQSRTLTDTIAVG